MYTQMLVNRTRLYLMVLYLHQPPSSMSLPSTVCVLLTFSEKSLHRTSVRNISKNVFRKGVNVRANLSLHSLVQPGHLLLHWFVWKYPLPWWQSPAVLSVRILSCCSPQGPSRLVFSVVQKKREEACDSAGRTQNTTNMNTIESKGILMINNTAQIT